MLCQKYWKYWGDLSIISGKYWRALSIISGRLALALVGMRQCRLLCSWGEKILSLYWNFSRLRIQILRCQELGRKIHPKNFHIHPSNFECGCIVAILSWGAQGWDAPGGHPNWGRSREWTVSWDALPCQMCVPGRQGGGWVPMPNVQMRQWPGWWTQGTTTTSSPIADYQCAMCKMWKMWKMCKWDNVHVGVDTTTSSLITNVQMRQLLHSRYKPDGTATLLRQRQVRTLEHI